MRVIITGGSGQIGRDLVASLARDGHEVIVLSRDPSAVTGLPANARAERWDARTAQGWGHLADGADAIFNLAGENIAGGDSVFAILLRGRWTPARKHAILHSRLDAGRAVVEAVTAAARKPTTLIQASAVGYYGNQGDKELPDDAPPGEDFFSKVCVEWEKSTEAVEALGVRRVVTRSAVVLSVRGGLLPVIRFPYSLFAGGPLGSGRQWFPWIHSADEVAAMRFLLESADARGAYNLAAPGAVTSDQFGRALGRAMGRPHLIPAPAFALRLALGEIADRLVLTSHRQVPKRLRAAGFQYKFPDVEAALRDLVR
jgi:uncharacterized protein (TIGR01777 family)